MAAEHVLLGSPGNEGAGLGMMPLSEAGLVPFDPLHSFDAARFMQGSSAGWLAGWLAGSWYGFGVELHLL
jgi:hypothetical protein